jgi:hypothetical protein
VRPLTAEILGADCAAYLRLRRSRRRTGGASSTARDGGLFVPVLSTHKDAKAAREAFAELQKQHVAILGAKQSEVQSSASGSGTWHRLVVTPASSKEAATGVCNKLRAAGYGRCWVKPY